MQNKMNLSIIIPTKLAHHHLKKCLNGLKKTLKGVNYEIIVVVNDDPINLREEKIKLENHDDNRIKPLYPGKDLGIAGALNFGLDKAKGEYIFITNDDIKIKTKGWFDEYEDFFNNYKNIGTLGFKGNDAGFTNNDPISSEISKKIYPLIQEIKAYHNHKEAIPAEEVAWNHTCAIFSTKDRLLSVNAFDEKFWPYGDEDMDLSMRLMINGYRHFRIPIKYYHYGDKLKISKHGGATHNIIKNRDKNRGIKHNIDFVEKNRKYFEAKK